MIQYVDSNRKYDMEFANWQSLTDISLFGTLTTHSVWQEELFSPASPLGVIWAARQQLPARLVYIWCSPSLYRDTFYQCFTTGMGASYRVRCIIRIFINCWLKCEVCQCASVRGSARPDLADRQLYHCYNWRKYRDINYNGNGQSCYRENKYIYMSTNLYKKMMISLV